MSSTILTQEKEKLLSNQHETDIAIKKDPLYPINGLLFYQAQEIKENIIQNYAERFDIKEGKMCNRRPLSKDEAFKLTSQLNTLFDSVENVEVKKQLVINKQALQKLVYLDDNYFAWKLKATTVKINYNEQKVTVTLPNILFVVNDNELSVFAEVNGRYYLLMLPNIHDDSTVCMGSNTVRHYSAFGDIEKAMTYNENAFFMSPFNKFHYTHETFNKEEVWKHYSEMNKPKTETKTEKKSLTKNMLIPIKNTVAISVLQRLQLL